MWRETDVQGHALGSQSVLTGSCSGISDHRHSGSGVVNITRTGRSLEEIQIHADELLMKIERRIRNERNMGRYSESK